jgi:hypothetical protein
MVWVASGHLRDMGKGEGDGGCVGHRGSPLGNGGNAVHEGLVVEITG